APEKVTVTDLFYLWGMDVGLVNIPYLLARYLRLFDSGRKRMAMISGGHEAADLHRARRYLGLGSLETRERLYMPVHAPQPPHHAARPARTMAQRLSQMMSQARVRSREIMGLAVAHPAGLWRCWHHRSCVCRPSRESREITGHTIQYLSLLTQCSFNLITHPPLPWLTSVP
nr:hypothetical protein [Tanacetum cinerariifolium]